MNFAAPLALLGAVLLTLPIWAHLKKEVDLPSATLPTAHLLNASEADADHRRRLQDWIWLAARILMVVLLVLAAAAPFLRLPVAYGDGSHRSVCVVVDDSMSMMRAGKDGVRLIDRAIERAEEIIGDLPEESEVCLIAAGKPARVLVPRTSTMKDVRANFGRLAKDSYRSGDSEGALQLVERELTDARWEVRSAVVIADATQGAGWQAWNEAPSEGIDFSFEALEAPRDNFTFGVVDASASQPQKGTATLTVEILGSKDGTVAVTMEQGAAERQHKSASVRNGRAKVRFEARAGSEAVQLSLEGNDGLALDDQLTVLPPGHGRLRVLTISDSQDDMLFVESAFARASWSSRVTYERIEPHRVRSAYLEGVTLLIADDPTLIPLSKETLGAFVREGGNLWIAIEDKDSVQAMRNLLDTLLPARVGQVVKEEPPLKVQVSLPSGEQRLGGTVNQRLLIEELKPGSRVWASYEDGIPAIANWEVGEGSVTLFTGPLGDQWGTLPFSPTYLPLISELMIESAPILERHPNAIEIGSELTLRTPPDTVRVAFTSEEGTWDDFKALDRPGHYQVSVETQRASMSPAPSLDFVLRPPISESELRAAQPPASQAEQARAGDQAAYRSQPLQGWAFGLFGLLFLAEGLARLRPWFKNWLGLASSRQRLSLSRQS